MSYDRRRSVMAQKLGTLGVSIEQISTAVRSQLGSNPESNVNVMFGAVGTFERSLFVPFTATIEGKTIQGKVVFQIIEANSRMWGGDAILLETRVDLS